MNEWDSGDLPALAPRVDERVSKELFDRRRARRRWQRRGGVGATAAVVVLAIALVAVAWPSGRSDDDGDLVGAASLGPTDFEVLELPDGVHGDVGALGAAVDTAGLEALWADLDGTRGTEPPRIDFRNWVVVSITVAASDCRPPLVAFQIDGSVVVPRFTARPELREQPMVCGVGPGVGTYVVALDRDVVPSTFTLHLPISDANRDGTNSLTVEVPERPEEDLGDPSDIDIEVLAVRRAPPGRAGELRAATDEASFRETWMANGLGQAPTVPVVDFDDRVVVFFSTSRGACAPALQGFSRTGHTLTPLVADASERSTGTEPSADQGCGPIIRVHTFVVAIDQADVGEGFVLRLPGDDATHGETTRRVAVP